jgi:hypothetical protein
MAYIKREFDILVSSDPSLGAINVSNGVTDAGSRFSIPLPKSLQIPKNAQNVVVSPYQATVWWTVPNIILGVNSRFLVTQNDTQAIPVQSNYVLDIPTGLYDLPGLNSAIQFQLSIAMANSSTGFPGAQKAFMFTADNSTQKVQFSILGPGAVTINFPAPGGFGPIMGFPSNTNINMSELAPNVASFNTINSFLLNTDLVTQGFQINGNFSNTIAQVLINVAPGFQIIYAPQKPPVIPCPELSQGIRTILTFWLTDQNLRPVNTNGEFWTVQLHISYLEPVNPVGATPAFPNVRVFPS